MPIKLKSAVNFKSRFVAYLYNPSINKSVFFYTMPQDQLELFVTKIHHTLLNVIPTVYDTNSI